MAKANTSDEAISRHSLPLHRKEYGVVTEVLAPPQRVWIGFTTIESVIVTRKRGANS